MKSELHDKTIVMFWDFGFVLSCSTYHHISSFIIGYFPPPGFVFFPTSRPKTNEAKLHISSNGHMRLLQKRVNPHRLCSKVPQITTEIKAWYKKYQFSFFHNKLFVKNSEIVPVQLSAAVQSLYFSVQRYHTFHFSIISPDRLSVNGLSATGFK